MRLLNMGLLLAIILFYSSCAKNDTEVQPAIDVTGTWQLEARMPFPDTSWHPITAKDSASLVFSPNGQFVFDTKASRLTGTYKVLAAGSRVKLILTGTDSLNQYLEVEQLSDSTIKLDDWLKGFAKGYSSSKLVRVHVNK